jgi:hypothetical protein
MIFGLLVLITALSISAVAIYYSVAGLVAIFAAAALPIMIMGGTLEIAKLVTAVWLHKNWSRATWWLKTYLSIAVVVLMLITSMGIFGFLSKAHIEQTSASDENFARIETIQSEIDRNLAIVSRAENRIRVLEASESNTSEDVQGQIDKEQERIDSAYSRIQPAIDEQNEIIKGQTNLYSSQLEALDNDFNQLQAWVNEGTEDAIKRVQGMVGTTPDGDWGFLTSNAVDKWREANRAKREELVEKIASIAEGNVTIENARAEIARLRKQADDQIKSSNAVIDRLRTRLVNDDKTADIEKNIDEQNERVRSASSEIDRLTEEKINLEAEYRKLEAEVGPIKYIAEFIYGDTADKNMLEEAVRWVILIIIFVFDPLAVLLLLAAQYTFEYRRDNKDDGGDRLRLKDSKDPVLDKEYEDTRAQRIVDNVPPTFEEERTEDVPEPTTTTDDGMGDVLSKDDIANSYASTIPVEPTEVQVDEPQPQVESKKKNQSDLVTQDTLSEEDQPSEELKTKRTQELEVQEVDEEWQTAKKAWKDDHPNLSLKTFKHLYVEGKIDELPWEKYKPKNFIAKEGNVQVKKETTEETEGYIQNAEQNEESLWKKLQNKKPE